MRRLVGVAGAVGAAWLTECAWPAMVTEPLRLLVVVLPVNEYVTLPLPVPEAPAVTVIQFALLVAVHVQALADAVTDTVPVPAADPTELDVGAIVNVQLTPLWLIDTLRPATVSDPLRDVVAVFASAE
jgi:hypothetical protein